MISNSGYYSIDDFSRLVWLGSYFFILFISVIHQPLITVRMLTPNVRATCFQSLSSTKLRKLVSDRLPTLRDSCCVHIYWTAKFIRSSNFSFEDSNRNRPVLYLRSKNEISFLLSERKCDTGNFMIASLMYNTFSTRFSCEMLNNRSKQVFWHIISWMNKSICQVGWLIPWLRIILETWATAWFILFFIYLTLK